jgi:hypothetical protein
MRVSLDSPARLLAALAEVVPTPEIGQWLDTPNTASEGSTPLQVIERGETDRIWCMIPEIKTGASGAKRTRSHVKPIGGSHAAVPEA